MCNNESNNIIITFGRLEIETEITLAIVYKFPFSEGEQQTRGGKQKLNSKVSVHFGLFLLNWYRKLFNRTSL